MNKQEAILKIKETLKSLMKFESEVVENTFAEVLTQDGLKLSYDADWSPIEYMGRAEKLYKYKGFGRKISMAFTVVAQSREEITAISRRNGR